MIIDVNAYLGHFAFRQLRHNTAASLLALMDSKGIDKAVVSSAAAITYRNAQSGNEELAAEIKGHRDRLIPLAVINPFYAGWQDDLKICHEEFGMTGLRLYPKWHNYQLSRPMLSGAVTAATERGMVISIPIRVEDSRERSWLVDVPDVPLAEIVDWSKLTRKPVSFCSTASATRAARWAGRTTACRPTTRSRSPASAPSWPTRSASSSQTSAPSESMFGTGMPFNYPDPALVKLEVLDATDADKDKIRSQNAASWLRLLR